MTLGPKSAQLRAMRERNFELGRAPKTSTGDAARTPKPSTAPVQASAPPQGKTMTKKAKTKKPAKTKQAKKTKAAKTAAREGGVRPGSKLEAVVALLTRSEGCTSKDVLEATGWPSVSLPQQAKAAGLTLRKEKDGSVSRYWGTPQ